MNKAMLLKQYMFNNKKKSGRLPSAYQEVEYIESTGTQYIDSGYKINDNKVKVQIKFRITDWNESGFYFGCGYVGGSNAFTASTSYLAIGANSISAFPNQDSMVGVINELEMEANEITKKYSFSIIKGISGTGSYSGTIKSNLSMPIFKGTLYSSCCDCRVYSFRLYVNDVLVRDYIPCYRKSDNEIGLYDIVNNQFYTNQGTGSFLCGRPLVYDTISGYEQIDYIETTGTQWIDTNYIPTIDDVIDADIEFTSIAIKPVESWLTVFGAYPTKSLWLFKEMNGVPVYFCTYSGGSNVYKIMQVSTNIPYNIIFKKDTFIVNGTSYSINNETRTSQDTLSLFRVNPYSASAYPCFTGKLKTFRVYKNNECLINLIPMRRLSDNELGLYDLVNGVFYTNQGSGSFIAGEVLKA